MVRRHMSRMWLPWSASDYPFFVGCSQCWTLACACACASHCSSTPASSNVRLRVEFPRSPV
eukprot:6432772-Alexandrium_andersonii.AAC.1